MTVGSEQVARRALLRNRGNPRVDVDYIVTFDGLTAGGSRVELAYVPDKLLLDAAAFDGYLAAFGNAAAGIESLVLEILDDIGNEIVPRWVRVTVSAPSQSPATRLHSVIVEDRQPNWDNPFILANVRNAIRPALGGDTD